MVKLSSPVHLYFKDVYQQGKAGCQDKIHAGYDEPDFKSHVRIGYQVKPFRRQFGNSNNANNS